MKEINQAHLERLFYDAFNNIDLYSARIVLARTLNYLLAVSQQEQVAILQDSLALAAEKIQKGENFSFYLIDKTQAGGAHEVKVFYNVLENRVVIQIPPEPDSNNSRGIKGGRFPTVCHGIEMVVAVSKIARIDSPAIEFASSAQINLGEFSKPLLVPLTIDPPNTNLIIFHTQSRSVDPHKLAQGWYEIMKTDEQLAEDPLRHTILVMPKSSSNDIQNPHFELDQPQSKKSVHVEVLPKEVAEDRSRFRPMHLNRIGRWSDNNGNSDNSKPTIVRQGARYIMTIE